MKTKVLKPKDPIADQKLLQEAADCVRQGGLVIFPTETVYGIAVDIFNPEAVLRLRSVKQRSESKHFSMMVAQKEDIAQYTSQTNPQLFKLIQTYTPGPLTYILPSKNNPLETVGIRIPNHDLALKFLELIKTPIFAPSANIEGQLPPQTLQQALENLDGLVDMAIDGGSVNLGVASTIVDMTQKRPTVIRAGVITQKDIERVCATKNILFICTGNSCRSVMAEYVFRSLLKDRSDIRVMSAGTHARQSSSATFEALQVLKQEGIDASAHRSQWASPWLLKQADLIFVMTQGHRAHILEVAPDVAQRVYLLGEFKEHSFQEGASLDIVDPIGGSLDEYQHCLLNIKDCFKKIIELV